MPSTPPDQHEMFSRRLHALVTGLILLVTAFYMVVVVRADAAVPPWQGVDQRWLDSMVDAETPWLTTLARFISRLGGPYVTFPLRVIVVAVLSIQRRWLQLGAFVGATVSAELCIGPLKSLVERPRPPSPLVGTSSSSFPSGHAIAGAVTAFGLVVVFMHASPRRLLAIGGAAAFAGLMALSRTYLAVHWLTDVVAGVCIGTGMALTWPAALELVRARRRPEREHHLDRGRADDG
jgi:undecaprenyl-diphosphatase